MGSLAPDEFRIHVKTEPFGAIQISVCLPYRRKELGSETGGPRVSVFCSLAVRSRTSVKPSLTSMAVMCREDSEAGSRP